MQGYVDDITHTNANTLTLLNAQAQLALDKWADAQLALINVNAAAAVSYSNGVGVNIQKQRIEALQDAADASMADLIRICELGGQTIPTVNDSVAFWDMSGVSYE